MAHLLLLALFACGTEYGLSSAPDAEPTAPAAAPEVLVVDPGATDAAPSAPGKEPPRLRPVPIPVHSGALEARESAERDLREEVFAVGGGERTPVSDILFVLDGSISMEAVVDQVRAGFDALSKEEGVFPERARVGVMGTTPADLERPGRLHPLVRFSPGLLREPGLGDLVSGERIARYREVAPPAVAEGFVLDGCDPWFAPDAENGDGQSCLEAHTQIGMTVVRVEAGLVALKQRLQRGPLFRQGAAVNVVFVSDTHDPGVANLEAAEDLVAFRPDHAELVQLVGAHHVLSGFRVHAIAPASPCGEEHFDEASYFEVAQASGGRTLDLCTARPEDYVALVRSLAVEGAVPQEPVLALGKGAAEVEQVLVDGERAGFSLGAGGSVVVLDGGLPSRTRRVEVRYRPNGVVRGPATGGAPATPVRPSR